MTDWRTRREQAVGLCVLSAAGTLGVLVALALVVGCAVGLSWVAEAVR